MKGSHLRDVLYVVVDGMQNLLPTRWKITMKFKYLADILNALFTKLSTWPFLHPNDGIV